MLLTDEGGNQQPPGAADRRAEVGSPEYDVNGQDREEFTEFMKGRWPGLVRLAYALTGDRWLAEDLAQAALAAACYSWRRVRRADDPDAYVRRILINAAHRRFRERRRSAAERDGPQPALADLADLAEAADTRSDLLAALGGLPKRQRAVIVLRYWADLSDAQVAELLGCSEGTVRSQAWRALAKLRVSPALAAATELRGDANPRGDAGGIR
jgi:RNA polymerase sigma-70 factor (sigma-E family)